MSQNISISESNDPAAEVELQIAKLSARLDTRAVEFAYEWASGKKQKLAYMLVYGAWSTSQCMVVCKRGARELKQLLQSQESIKMNHKLGLDRDSLVALHMDTMMIARRNYLDTGEAAQLAQYSKLAGVINRMIGADAPQEVHIKGVIAHANMANLSPAQSTEAYKRIMKGDATLDVGEVFTNNQKEKVTAQRPGGDPGP